MTAGVDPAVPTVSVTEAAPFALICTEEFDKEQVGARVTAGATLQLRFTAPTKDPFGVTARLKFAFCPALTVKDVGDPASSKSGAA
jgi:hypothetical protein